MSASDPRAEFLQQLRSALADGSFVRLVLGKPRAGQLLLKITAERVVTARGTRLQLHFRERQRDLTKPADAAAIVEAFEKHVGPALGSAHLFTESTLWQFELNKKGEPRLTRGRAPAIAAAPAPHDRAKQREIAPADAPWLHALGLAGADGRILADATAKFRQINRYVELLLPLCEQAGLAARDSIRVFDMGSGKGYLTFAAWHALTRSLGRRAEIVGIEARPELVELCNAAATGSGCDGLRFEAGRIVDAVVPAADVLIALHACDTATDEALFRGIRAGAALIVAAPCCHKEIRPQLHAPAELAALARHGIFAARLADMVTDSLRALLLEAHGYEVKVFEFIDATHTPKNTMLAAVRRARPDEAAAVRARTEFAALKSRFGIARQHLETLLATPAPAT
ncbi:MAG TPA: SAM-dependent methyltransferase [Opitutaceae bacterium]|nr:SAM-dependent methyltransferase [Opitutaceae bacterium]